MQDEPPPAGGQPRGRFTTATIRDRTAADTGYQETSKAGHAISQRITPAEVAAVRVALDPGIPERLGITEAELRRFVRGEMESAYDLPPETLEELSRIAKATARTGMWPRKIAAILWGLHIERIQVP